jgi:hypothetical protein
MGSNGNSGVSTFKIKVDSTIIYSETLSVLAVWVEKVVAISGYSGIHSVVFELGMGL